LPRSSARSSHRRRSRSVALAISALIARAPGDGSSTSSQLVEKTGIHLAPSPSSTRRRFETSRQPLSTPPRLCVQPTALACALFDGTADGRARDHGADRTRDLGADRANARRRVTTIAQLVEKTGIDPRAAAAASQRQAADAAIAAASCARPRARRG
jgi:hypothetical protein